MSGIRLRRILGITLLLISLLLLAWSLWPIADVIRSVPIQPGDMQLPTPEGFLDTLMQII